MPRYTFRLTALAALLGLVSTSFADRRFYVWTYQYQTMPKANTELEFYQTSKLREVDQNEYRIEIEHGLTSRWDASLYEIFVQNEGGNLKWDAWQLRTRYRFGEVGQYFMDPLLYIEYNRKTESTSPNKVEAKFILAKTIDKWNLAVNPVFEYFFAPDTENEIGLDVGTSYEFSPKFVAGIESTTRVEFEDGESETSSYFGPTVSYASGGFWCSAGVAAGVTDESDDARVRFIFGIDL
jgi:hypothetical protein